MGAKGGGMVSGVADPPDFILVLYEALFLAVQRIRLSKWAAGLFDADTASRGKG